MKKIVKNLKIENPLCTIHEKKYINPSTREKKVENFEKNPACVVREKKL